MRGEDLENSIHHTRDHVKLIRRHLNLVKRRRCAFVRRLERGHILGAPRLLYAAVVGAGCLKKVLVAQIDGVTYSE